MSTNASDAEARWKMITSSLGEDSKLILKLATRYSNAMGHYYLGSEHLFMAMTKIEGSLTRTVLKSFGLDPDEVRARLKTTAGPFQEEPLWEGIISTPRTQKAFATAHKLARDENYARFGERHLLVAILDDPDGLPFRTLEAIGQGQSLDPYRLRRIAREAEWKPPAEGVPPYNIQLNFGEQADEEARQEFPQVDFLRGAPTPDHTPVLDKYGRDLTAEARQGKLHEAIGTEEIQRRIGRVLIQLGMKNPLLVGKAGVGKTAIVEGLANRLVQGPEVIAALREKRIVEISANSLVAGASYRGQLERRIEQVLAEVKADPNLIVFIDEIHAILGGGSGDSLSSIANAIKPALARGDFPCIGATTVTEYRRYIESDDALARRFEVIFVEEPSIADCIEILRGLKPKLEARYSLHINDQAIVAVVQLTARYLPDESLPAKAVKLLEQACTWVKLPSLTEGKIPDDRLIFTEVSEDLVRHVLTEKTGIPLARLTSDELVKLKDVEAWLTGRVHGQNEAVHVVGQALKRQAAGLSNPRHPLGVFLFVGPTGVGKTELARSVAEFLFQSPDALVRIDMSEFQEKHQVARLIGAPPGYVGYTEEGQLTGKLRLHPYSVVLLDEIEKAHPDVHHLFLQLFDEGRLTDARGRTVNGREALYVMTSNLGSETYSKVPTGFGTVGNLDPAWLSEKRREIEKIIREKFKPEFLNRVDEIVHFNPLSYEDLTGVFHILIREAQDRLIKQRSIHLRVSREAAEFVCQTSYDPLQGARPLRRAIDRLIMQSITEMILAKELKDYETVNVGLNGQVLTFGKTENEKDER